jgi:predicted PurR-regulated permease PerM
MTKAKTPEDPNALFYRRVFALVTAALLGVALYHILNPFFSAIAWAILIAFLLHPVHERFTRWLKGRASLSAVLLTISTLFIAVGPLAAIGVAFARQTATLLERLQDRVGDVEVTSVSSLKTLPLVGRALEWLESSTPISSEQLQSWAVSSARSVLQYFASVGGTLFMGAIGTVIGFTLMLFLLFFFVRDGEMMAKRLVSLVPMQVESKQKLERFVGDVTRAVVFGTLLTAILQGFLLGIGLALAGIPSAVVLAVVGAVLALLPMGGTAFIWIPAVIYLASQGQYGWAIFLFIWGAGLVSLVDNFVKPMMISGRTQVPTLAAFLGVLGGLAAFGPVGMFLGPVLIALILALLRQAQELRAGEAPSSTK